VSTRQRYGIPNDDESAERFIAGLMRHDVPRRTRGSAPKQKPRLSSSPPKCAICRKWLIPSINHATCH
jgi:hypothetical protein